MKLIQVHAFCHFYLLCNVCMCISKFRLQWYYIEKLCINIILRAAIIFYHSHMKYSRIYLHHRYREFMVVITSGEQTHNDNEIIIYNSSPKF